MTVPPELLKQVKGIALRTRGVVDSLFSGEFRSVFRQMFPGQNNMVWQFIHARNFLPKSCIQ